MNRFLLRIEGVNLSTFIFDTNNISTSRGGSLLLLRAADGVIESIRNRIERSGGQVERVCGGASMGLAIVSATAGADAATIRSWAEASIRDHDDLRYATVMVVVKPLGDDETFVPARDGATAVARWRQMQSPTISLCSFSAAADAACQYDKTRPATERVQRGAVGGGSDIAVSAATKARFKFGRDQRQQFYSDELGGILAPIATTDNLQNLCGQPLSSEERLSGKMAVLYFDGNDFGSLHQAVRGETDQRELDACLQGNHKAFLGAALAGMQQSARWRTSGGELRIETLLWGGDDLAFVVPAWCGWQFAQQFFRLAKNWEYGTRPLTYAGGMVFCHAEASIHRVRALAGRLCDEMAKPVAKESGNATHALATVVLESIDDIPGDLRTMLGRRFSLATSALNGLVLRGPDLGEQMRTLADARERLATALPRRQLIRAAYRPRNSMNGPERKDAVDKLRSACREAGLEESLTEALKCLAGRGNPKGSSEFVPWIQLAEWWDYMAIPKSEADWVTSCPRGGKQ